MNAVMFPTNFSHMDTANRVACVGGTFSTPTYRETCELPRGERR